MAITTPSTKEIQTTAMDCFKSESRSGHEIFLNSVLTPLKKLGFAAFAFFAESGTN